MKKRYTEEQTIRILKQADTGILIPDLTAVRSEIEFIPSKELIPTVEHPQWETYISGQKETP